MIIPSDFALAYNQVSLRLEKLQRRAQPLLEGVAHHVGGEYSGRIKPTESLLLKIVKEGIERPFDEVDDLFAATITVANGSLIPRVEEEIRSRFAVVSEVPPKTKRPEQFVYDDRHLILKLKHEAGRADPEVDDLVFELQIRTKLQAAASAVSRDLNYKTKRLSWTRARLASRIRALVEMADELLAKLDEMPEEAETAETYEQYIKLNRIIVLLEQLLTPEQIPEDRRRLAHIVDGYLSLCRPPVSLADLETILNKLGYERFRTATSLTASASIFIIRNRSDIGNCGRKCPEWVIDN
jgi:ppGpp synthetase/RelA/SpoT-type nucleotidyltranferase